MGSDKNLEDNLVLLSFIDKFLVSEDKNQAKILKTSVIEKQKAETDKKNEKSQLKIVFWLIFIHIFLVPQDKYQETNLKTSVIEKKAEIEKLNQGNKKIEKSLFLILLSVLLIDVFRTFGKMQKPNFAIEFKSQYEGC